MEPKSSPSPHPLRGAFDASIDGVLRAPSPLSRLGGALIKFGVLNTSEGERFSEIAASGALGDEIDFDIAGRVGQILAHPEARRLWFLESDLDAAAFTLFERRLRETIEHGGLAFEVRAWRALGESLRGAELFQEPQIDRWITEAHERSISGRLKSAYALSPRDLGLVRRFFGSGLPRSVTCEMVASLCELGLLGGGAAGVDSIRARVRTVLASDEVRRAGPRRDAVVSLWLSKIPVFTLPDVQLLLELGAAAPGSAPARPAPAHPRRAVLESIGIYTGPEVDLVSLVGLNPADEKRAASIAAVSDGGATGSRSGLDMRGALLGALHRLGVEGAGIRVVPKTFGPPFGWTIYYRRLPGEKGALSL